jgi:hypothetical protein
MDVEKPDEDGNHPFHFAAAPVINIEAISILYLYQQSMMERIK